MVCDFLTSENYNVITAIDGQTAIDIFKEQIYNAVWKEAYYGNENVLNTHINRLGSKLSDSTDKANYIRTLWGIGYKME